VVQAEIWVVGACCLFASFKEAVRPIPTLRRQAGHTWPTTETDAQVVRFDLGGEYSACQT
jgi:hypothetical protein